MDASCHVTVNKESIAPTLRVLKKMRFAVVLHLYYEDQWPEFAAVLGSIPDPFSLFVTLSPKSDFEGEIRRSFPDAVVSRLPNVGRDVAPFLALLPALQAFDVVCKVHTKRSEAVYIGWRRLLLHGLLGSAETVRAYVDAFEQEPDLVLAGPTMNYVDGEAHIYYSRRALTLQHGELPAGWGFFAGTMFWCRPSFFVSLKNIYPQDVFVAHGDDEGHPEHVIERAFGLMARCADKKIMLGGEHSTVAPASQLRGNPDWNGNDLSFKADLGGEPAVPQDEGAALSSVRLYNEEFSHSSDTVRDIAPVDEPSAQPSGHEDAAVAAALADGKPYVALAIAARDLIEHGESYETLSRVATIEAVLGHNIRAKRTWKRALVFKHDPQAYAAIGSILVLEGDLDSGIAMLQSALALSPKNASLLSEIGVAYIYRDDAANARRYASRALHIDPANNEALLCKARADLFFGDIEPARAQIAALFRSGYKIDEVHLLQVDLFAHLEEFEPALVLAADLCERYPASDEALSTFRRAFRAFQRSEDTNRYQSFLDALSLAWDVSASPQVKVSPLDDRAGVDIVMPVHNAPEMTQNSIKSILQHSGHRLGRLIIVDDGSGAKTVEMLAEMAAQDGRIEVLRCELRLGYTRAVIQGIASSTSVAFVVINSDTLVTSGWLDSLYAALKSDPKVAMVGPLSNNAAWQNYGPVFSAHDGFRITPVPEQPLRDAIIAGSEGGGLVPLPMLHGFCIMVDRVAYDAVGGFDATTFPEGYGETQDLSIRLGIAGHRLCVVTDCVVFHEHGASISSQRRGTLSRIAREKLYARYSALNYLCFEMVCCENPHLGAVRSAVSVVSSVKYGIA
jgi:GT2 family glycosyltransferase/Tfp pilus assembly protein PilF